MFNQRRDDSDKEDHISGSSSSFSLIDAVDRLSSILAQPLPIVQVTAGWVLVLLIQAAIAGVVPAIVAAVLFGTLRAVAQNLVVFEETLDEDVYGITAGAAGKTEDEQEEEQTLQLQIDGATIVLSIFTAQLLVPDKWISVSAAATAVFPIVALLALVALLVKNAVGEIAQEEELTKDDKLLNQWDKKYRQQQTKSTDD